MSKCKYCIDGYRDCGDGTVYECVQCNHNYNSSSRNVSAETFDLIQDKLKEPAMPTLMLSKLMRRKR